MHGNEVVGREMLILLIKLFCDNYVTNPFLTSFVDNTRIHIMPTMNPDGYEKAHEGEHYSQSRQNGWPLQVAGRKNGLFFSNHQIFSSLSLLN